MKLVEILARELKDWPKGAIELGQWPDGDVCIRSKAVGSPCAEVYTSIHIADDVDAWVTRAQWEAERERIAKMSKEQNVWQQAIDHELIVAHIGVAGDASYSEASEKLRCLIDWHVKVATDPAVNGGFSLVQDKSYDQELWDKAYMHAWTQMLSESAGGDMSHFNVGTAGSARMADAFMAERAKRVSK